MHIFQYLNTDPHHTLKRSHRILLWVNFNHFPLGRPVIFLCYKHDIYFVHVIFLSTGSLHFVQLEPVVCCLTCLPPTINTFNHPQPIISDLPFYKT